MTLIFDFDMHIFLGLGDSAVFHCMLCLFVSGSYWKTQVSSPVMICLIISGLSLIFSSMSSQILTQFCFWSSDKVLGTILAHTFHIPRSSSKIICTDSQFRLSSSNIIHTVNLQLLCTSCFTLVMLLSILIVEGHLVLKSFSTSLQPFSKCLCHLKLLPLCVIDIAASPLTSLRSLKHSNFWAFLSFTKNFKLIHSSILELLTVS